MYENMAPAIKLALDSDIPISSINKGLLKVDIKGRLQILRKGKLLKNLNSNGNRSNNVCDFSYCSINFNFT